MIGRMDERITLRRVTRSQDDLGGTVETWADIATVWAQVRASSGREESDGQRVNPVTRFRAVIWWKCDATGSPFYTAADKVSWRGREYGIESVAPIGRNDKMELRLVEGGVT